MRAVTRVAAAVVLLGQLQSLPASVACARVNRAEPAPCHQTTPPPAPAGPAFAAADDAACPACPLMQCCLARVALLAETALVLVPHEVVTATVADQAAPVSYLAAPPLPPPEG